MRLVTWNCCRGPYLKKVQLLDVLAPDIAVIQECARPIIQTDRCLWFGDNPRQGLAVQAYGQYRLRALPLIADVPNYVIPVEVIGPNHFLIIAVWSKRDPRGHYVEGVVRAVQQYRSLFAQYPTVLVGDLNSNAIWDSSHRVDRSHSALVTLLSELGLVSSYHSFYDEAHGEESQPTFYFQWKQPNPFHIDYCFIPQQWAARMHGLKVGSYEDWKSYSDHRPLLVELTDSDVDVSQSN